jgi:uncharacterized protein (TIRG00374 family)
MTHQTTIPARRRYARLASQWLLPVVLIAFVIITGHLGDALRVLGSTDVPLALTLVATGLALPVSHAWRWRFLLARTGESIRLGPAVELTALASLINYAAPGFLGAPAKAVLARQSHGVPLSRSAPTLVVEQTLDAIVLAAAGGVALLIAGPTVLGTVVETAGARAVVVTLVLGVALALLVAVGFLLARRFRPRFVDALRVATAQVLTVKSGRVQIVAGTTARWVLDMAAFWIAALAVGLTLSVPDLLLIGNVSLLVGVLSPVPGGIGVREATMAALGAAVGLAIPAILAMAVLHRAGLGVALPIMVAACRVASWRQR